MSKNESLLNKIKALLSKTVESGCTEQEAYLATQKAAELMDRHGFDESDLSVKENIIQKFYDCGSKHVGDVGKLSGTIGKYCDVMVWTSRGYHGVKIVYFGRESDVEMAVYLTHLFANAMETEWKKYFTEIKGVRQTMHGRTIRTSFMVGMAIRIAQRLHEMKDTRNTATDINSGKTGRDLVIVKNADVKAAFDDLEMKLRNAPKSQVRVGNSAGFSAGHAAGNRVNIVTGVNNSSVLKIV
jgi:hypothetical protein